MIHFVLLVKPVAEAIIKKDDAAANITKGLMKNVSLNSIM